MNERRATSVEKMPMMAATEREVTEPILCTRLKAAKRLGVALMTFDALVKQGDIVAVQLPGGGKKYSIEQLREWVRSRVRKEDQ